MIDVVFSQFNYNGDNNIIFLHYIILTPTESDGDFMVANTRFWGPRTRGQ